MSTLGAPLYTFRQHQDALRFLSWHRVALTQWARPPPSSLEEQQHGQARLPGRHRRAGLRVNMDTGAEIVISVRRFPIVPVAQGPVSWYNNWQAARSLTGRLMVISNGTARG
jgi:hypothetical protein